MFQALLAQLIHDLKASWKKTALLGILLSVFLLVSLPPVFDAFSDDASVSQQFDATNAGNQEPAKVLQTPQPKAATHSPIAHFDWDELEKSLQSDPLVQSVEVAAIRRDPFRIDRDQFPPPILFEDDPVDVRPAQLSAAEQEALAALPPKSPPGMVLKSTMIGARRRAAFINTVFAGRSVGRLYFEGREVPADDGEPYIISAIHPRKVILTRDPEVYELCLDGDQPAGSIELRGNGQTSQ